MTGNTLVTIGETMVLLSGPPIGKIRHAASLILGIGGAESNVAIGVQRLGSSATWIGRVGDDEFGELVVSRIKGEGVTTRAVIDAEAATGLMIKQRRVPGVSSVMYYRFGSAGSRLKAEDLDQSTIENASVLHLSGITTALSESARQCVFAALDIASAAGVPVSFDVNYRSALWKPDKAKRILRDVARRSTLVFAGDDEAELLLGQSGTPGDLARAMSALGPSEAIIKLGAHGAVALSGGQLATAPAHDVVAVDAVGAGDAFVAGYLTEYMTVGGVDQSLATANACGAFAVTVPGDWEGLPTRRDLALLSAAEGTVAR